MLKTDQTQLDSRRHPKNLAPHKTPPTEPTNTGHCERGGVYTKYKLVVPQQIARCNTVYATLQALFSLVAKEMNR